MLLLLPALTLNRPLLQLFANDVNMPQLTKNSYPLVSRISLWYSILDASDWNKGNCGEFMGWKRPALWFKSALRFCFRAYSPSKPSQFAGSMTLCEMLEDPVLGCLLVRWPADTQLIVATGDPIGLAQSSHRVMKLLRRKFGNDVQIDCVMFEGSTHGFVSYPPQLQRLLFGIDVGLGCCRAIRVVNNFMHQRHKDAIVAPSTTT